VETCEIDGLTHSLLTSSSRSDVIRVLAGGVLALAAAALRSRSVASGANCFKRAKRCRRNRQCCTGHCRNGWCR
jgi:hypothetical protein